MNKSFNLIVVVLCIGIFAACQKDPKQPEMKEENDTEAIETSTEKERIGKATLKDKDGMEVGLAILTGVEEGVKINVVADHLQPGKYGFHIHEKGLCEGPEFETAGGHFNPDDSQHGFEQQDGPHAGDLENLEVKEDGTVNQTLINKHVTLQKDEKTSLFNEAGTSLVLHESEDDYMSQPAGDAGARMACGEISEL